MGKIKKAVAKLLVLYVPLFFVYQTYSCACKSKKKKNIVDSLDQVFEQIEFSLVVAHLQSFIPFLIALFSLLFIDREENERQMP